MDWVLRRTSLAAMRWADDRSVSAADQKRCAEARDRLAKRMNRQQRAEAQKRASEWLAAFEMGKK